MPLTLQIVTPEARVYNDTVDAVVIPTVDGEIGILPGHIPLLTQVEHGELRVTKDGRTQQLAVGSGFAEIAGDTVSVLAENAMRVEAIDEAAVEKAIQRAQEALKDKSNLEQADIERLENVMRFSATQLLVKRNRR